MKYELSIDLTETEYKSLAIRAIKLLEQEPPSSSEIKRVEEEADVVHACIKIYLDRLTSDIMWNEEAV